MDKSKMAKEGMHDFDLWKHDVGRPKTSRKVEQKQCPQCYGRGLQKGEICPHCAEHDHVADPLEDHNPGGSGGVMY